ncbi:hypothetical protein [Cochleicola gelatinilyticus]|nr:hypothetical protein [Cochleicola gelatinilyticus]
MKKPIIAFILMLSTSFAVQAQVDVKTAVVNNNSPKQQLTTAAKPHQLAPTYTNVTVSDLPLAVTEAVATDFQTATISKAFVNNKGEYKLLLKLAEKENLTVFANTNGEWIKEE